MTSALVNVILCQWYKSWIKWINLLSNMNVTTDNLLGTVGCPENNNPQNRSPSGSAIHKRYWYVWWSTKIYYKAKRKTYVLSAGVSSVCGFVSLQSTHQSRFFYNAVTLHATNAQYNWCTHATTNIQTRDVKLGFFPWSKLDWSKPNINRSSNGPGRRASYVKCEKCSV